MRHTTILVAILAFVPLAGATAQVRPGARVPVTGHFCQQFYINCVGGSRQKYVRTFVTWEVDTLVVQSNGDTLSVHVNPVTRLHVSRVRKTSTGKGPGIGFLLGGVLGAVIGYASHEECVPQGGFSCIGPDFGPEAGGLGGLVVGAIIGGSPEVRLDRLRLSLGPQRDGGFGLGASVRF